MSFANEIDVRQTIEGTLDYHWDLETTAHYYLEYRDNQGVKRKALLDEEFIGAFWVRPRGPSKEIDGINGLEDFSSQKKVTVAFNVSQAILNEDDAKYAPDLREADIKVTPTPSFISSIATVAGGILNKLRGRDEEEATQSLRKIEPDEVGMIRAFGQVSEDGPTATTRTSDVPATSAIEAQSLLAPEKNN